MSSTLTVPDRHRRAVQCLIGALSYLQNSCQMQDESLDELCVGAYAAVELGAAWQGREGRAQAALSVAVEVPLAGESRPPGEDGQGDDLARTEGGLRSWPPFRRTGVAEVIDHDVECGEEGVHVEHEESVPFPSGSGSKPTLKGGHLPLKSSTDNSHQAFKSVSATAISSRPRWPYGRSHGRQVDPAQSPRGPPWLSSRPCLRRPRS